MQNKTLKQCQCEIAAKHRLGKELVTGHKVAYFDSPDGRTDEQKTIDLFRSFL